MQLIFIKLLLCILLIAQDVLSINIPSGDALEFDGTTQVVLPEFIFGGPFTIEVWALANFTERPGPLVFFGNEDDENSSYEDQVELGIDVNGLVYLTVGVTDRAGFIRKVPTNSTELAHILPHLSTSPADPVLVRRVQCAIPEEFSGRWVLIHVRGDSHGVISIYINKELKAQTSSLDISVLPAFLPRGINYIGANPYENFVGQIQVVSLWSRALATRDIQTSSPKVFDRALIGRWDFGYIEAGVLLNQAADDKYALKQKTEVIQGQLEAIQKQIDAAELALATATATATGEVAAERALAAARLDLSHARQLSSPTYAGVSVASVAPLNNKDQVNNIRELANSPSVWEDPLSVSAQIAELTGVTDERTTNALSDLAFIASQDTTEPETYLKAALDSMNRLPFKATNVNARPALKTTNARPTSVSNYGSITERIDGTIISTGAGKKRWLGWLIRFIYKLIKKCRPEELNMRCTWSNDPHYVLRPVRENWVSRYDYHSPSCHYILEVGDDILIQEQSYQCGGAGCISKVGAYVVGKYVIIFDSNGKITVNGEQICVPYTVDDDIKIINKDKKTPTLVVDGFFELSFTGSASLLFTDDQLSKASTRSICAQKGASGTIPASAHFDLEADRCFLNPKWQPPATHCPKCNNGNAVYDLVKGCSCECDPGWRGALCDQYYCEQCVAPSGTCQGPNNCKCNTTDPVYVFGCSGCQCSCNRDYCQNGGTVSVSASGDCECSCPEGFLGDKCQNPRCPVGLDNGYLCNGQGTCHANGTCECIKDVSYGEACEGNCTIQVCPSANSLTCTGHGRCGCGKCVCNPGFTGDDCSVPDCTNITATPDPSGCGSYGKCVVAGDSPACDCNDGWSGARCSVFTCTPTCSAHGNCTASTKPYCKCNLGFTSPDCSEITCNFLSDCSSPKGTCTLPEGADEPVCECKEHWTGKRCGKALCPNECSHQGDCIDSPSGSDTPPTCKCKSPWVGADCSELPDCEVDLTSGDWSSPEWQARATEICSNSSYISPDHFNNCLFDAQQIDNFEVLYSLAYHSYLECQHNETEGGPSCGTLCPNFCTFNGVCDPEEGVCQCNPGFYGADCSIQPNSRGYLIQYDTKDQEAIVNQVVHPASPRTYLNVSAIGATQSTNEIANAAVVFLYQDYRPKYSQCKPYNDLYLVVLVDQERSACSQTGQASFKFAVSFADASPITVAQAHHCTASTGSTGVSFSCSWKYGGNAAVVIGPLAQNQSWALDLALDTKDTCIDSVYYGSEAITGTTDLVPIPIAEASEIHIVSEILNSNCGTITSCGDCMNAEGCGWCPDLGYCMDGTPSGPTYGMCSVWRYDKDPTQSRVVATSGYSNPVFPSNLDVYLVDGSHVDAYAYVLFPADIAVESLFLVDLSSQMEEVVDLFALQASTMLGTIANTYPNSKSALSGFTDKPISPYGSAQGGDYVYTEYQRMTNDATAFANSARALKIANGGDSANAQLEALLQVALRSSSGFTGSHRVVVVITGTPYHVAPTHGKPNNLDTVIDSDEDYPFVADVRAALIKSNVVPLFLVTGGDALVANYTTLVRQLGFGAVRSATAKSISVQVLSGLEEIFSTATLVASSPKFIQSIFPAKYTSIQGNSRVKFTIALDRSALKRSELFDTTATLLAPGFGSVRLRLAKSDVPVGVDIKVSMKQNTKKTITLNGGNIYNTALMYKIASLPGNGTLLQFNGEPITAVNTEVTDPLHRVIYVPAPNGSCQHEAADYCSRRRFCYNPCPYATFQYSLVDSCASSSILVNVSVDVIADVVNNRPVASLPSPPSTLQDTNLPIFLEGYDKDGDVLSSIVASLPYHGQLLHMGKVLTAGDLPFRLSNRTVVYKPPYRRWGDDFDNFTYYVNDQKPSYQMGDSLPHKVSITVILTDHAPVVRNVRKEFPEGSPATVVLDVTDEDAIDFERGEVKVYMLDVPTPEQGVLQQLDGTVIKANDEVAGTKTFSVKFIPAIYGLYTFRYHAYDSQLFSNVANVTFNVTFVNQKPVTENFKVNTTQGVPIKITFPGYDREGDPITWTLTNTHPTRAALYDVAAGNVTIPSNRNYALKSGWIWFVPLSTEGVTLTFSFHIGTGQTYRLTVDIINVNDPPEITAREEINLVMDDTTESRTSVTLNDISFYDPDNEYANFTVSVQLSGDGSLEMSTRTGLHGLVITSTSISFQALPVAANDALKSITYSVQKQPGQTNYVGTIVLSIDDNAAEDPQTGTATIVIRTSTRARTATSVAATAGAVGAGAAAAVGLAVAYHFIKAKKLLPEESNPFASMGDDAAVDVVLENPLYKRPAL